MPFSYLANKYKDDVAIVWIDAHKDLNLQGDSYEGYHAMALAATFGLIDKEGIAKILPAHFNPKDSIIVGLRDFEGKKERLEIIQRQRQKTLDDIEKLQVVLEKLDYKVAYYKEMIAKQKDDINPLNKDYVKRKKRVRF